MSVDVEPRMWRGRSRNVYLTIAYNFVDGASFSVWQAQVLQVLIYSLSRGQNSTIGWISGAGGAAQVVAAIACGYLADKKAPRHMLCRTGSLFGAIAVAVTVTAVANLSIPMLYGSSVLWGLYSGLANPASEALFADSVLTGQRTGVYTVKWIVQVLCYTVGYGMNLIIFSLRGNTWDLPSLQIVMFVGIGFHIIALVLLALLSDGDALDKSLAVIEMEPLELNDKYDHDVKGMRPRSPIVTTDGLATVSIPFYVAVSDVLMSLGAGLSTRFLLLFFVTTYAISPSSMMALMAIAAVGTAVAAGFAGRGVERLFTRLVVVLAARVVGAAFLLWIASVHHHGGGIGAMLAAFLGRHITMNSTYGLSRSVVMDCVTKDRRARWAAFESLTSLSFAVSAAVGGILIDVNGYCATFLVAAVMHFAGSVVLSLTLRRHQ